MQSYFQTGFRQKRHGIQVLEVLLLFPVLLIATFSFFVLGPTVTVRQAVQHAAEETAREVAKKVGTQTTTIIATEVVNEVLSVHGLEGTNMPLALAPSGVRVDVWEYDALGMAIETTSLGDLTIPAPTNPPNMGNFTNPDQVIAQVTVAVDDAPIPNVLSEMKFDISGRYLTHRTTAFRDP
ncbi:TadE/TadG family type IV pilus assembly protein [Bremerella sp. T1]|uniref:TadE/TadG family type IV pilus assembly protein n=1 Tax=Bremerella sp. TYQ1 TaxID=3119568 RepID=UPI001CCCC771|nr:TadE family protein [Bremerella volcania]UBM36144.1 pilus assembly protein [Bremerella volcania]